MEVTTLKAENREAVGTNQVARLRENGRVPCVLYGAGGESRNLSLDESDVERELRHHHRVFRIDVGGTVEGVFLQDAQFDVISDRALHLDFRRIDLDKPIRVDVELVFIGHPAGATKGGVLVKDRIQASVMSLPAAMPENIEVPVKDVDVGDKITMAELVLPEGVTVVEGEEGVVVCHIPAKSGPAEDAADDGDEPGEG